MNEGMTSDGFEDHFQKTVRRFLLTPVVVDEEPTISGDTAYHD